MAASAPGPHWTYGLAVGVLGTASIAAAAALVAMLASMVASHIGRAAGAAVGVAPWVAGFLYVNATLFDGPWVRSRSWAPALEWAIKIGGAAALFGMPFLLGRMGRLRGIIRVLIAIALVAAAWITARLDQEYLAAYWQLKIQFAVLTWVFPSLGIWLLLAGRHVRLWPALIMLFVAMGVSIAGGLSVRENHIAIERARSIILTRPAPMLVRILRPIEETVFDRIRPLDAEPVRSTDAPLDPEYDPAVLAAALNSAAPNRADMNVLMIAIDAMRADHMSCEGYARPTTPNLDKFARRASWFRRAVAPVPASSMGYSSAMSGLFARVTPAYAKEFGVSFPVPEGYMLAEVMRDSGRETMGVTAFHPAVQNVPKFKILEKGFKVFNPDKSADEKSGSSVVDSAIGMLTKHGTGSAPWFMWMHIMEPHAPYHFHVGRDFGRRPIDAYDAEIAEADAQVARVFDWLEKSGQASRTIVAIFGDHGEGFGEHNNREHGASLYEHQVRVPLLISVPGVAPREVQQWATLADLTPTLLGAVGLDSKTIRTGRNLLPLMTGIKVDWPDWAYSERAASAVKVPRSWERAVWRGDKKLIWLPHDRTYQFYNLTTDPGELTNLWDSTDPTCQELVGIMRAADARIDSTWGASASRPSDESDSIDVKFAKLVDAALVKDRKASDGAIDAILTVLNSDAILLDSTKQDRLGRPALDRLLVGIRAELGGLAGGDSRRNSLTRIILYANRSDDVPLLATERSKTTNGDLRLRIAHALATFGNTSGKGDLVVALKNAPIEARITAAAGLGALGDNSGIALLQSALTIDHVGRLRESIFGLASLGDIRALSTQNSTMRAVYTNSWVQGALLEAALRAPVGDESTASLASLSRSTDTRIAKVASETLAPRLTPALAARRAAVGEALEGIRSALLYGDGVLAASFFKDLTADDDALIGSGWWLGVRTARSLGDSELLTKCATRLKSVMTKAGAPAGDIDGIEKLSPEIKGTAALLKAEPTDDFAVPLLHRGRIFSTTIKLTNVSGVRLGGGESPDAFRLEWRYVQANAKPVQGNRLIQVVLPLGGLEPGAACTLMIPGMFPDKVGEWTPVLVATRDWAGRRDDVLFTAPKVVLQ